ncbi:MAG: DUF2099 family protein [Eubacteriaceae bacterium]|nr:DUF2099 family protein [Eubacteriaceae bacterium]
MIVLENMSIEKVSQLTDGITPMKTESREYSLLNYETSAGILADITITLKQIPVEKYYGNIGDIEKYKSLQYDEKVISDYVLDRLALSSSTLPENFAVLYFEIKDYVLRFVATGADDDIVNIILDALLAYYEEHPVHITRMFGSYVLIGYDENKEAKALMATPIPIKYCPLMFKLLKEVGGSVAESMLATLKSEGADKVESQKMCELINQVVIKGGYFDTSRPLNSCEANVLFGASETIYSAFEDGCVDAAVIVSNNLGTIITTNAPGTQGAVKRMTGLFYSSPSAELNETAKQAGIIPVFEHFANIDQLEGVKAAIELGYKNIAVSIAADDNILHKDFVELEEEHGVNIYRFGLCSTGISEETAKVMMEDADVIWACASKWVREYVQPNAIAQVGVKIPVSIMTEDGYKLVSAHLARLNLDCDLASITPQKGENKPVFLSGEKGIICVPDKDVFECADCPNPCI